MVKTLHPKPLLTYTVRLGLTSSRRKSWPNRSLAGALLRISMPSYTLACSASLPRPACRSSSSPSPHTHTRNPHLKALCANSGMSRSTFASVVATKQLAIKTTMGGHCNQTVAHQDYHGGVIAVNQCIGTKVSVMRCGPCALPSQHQGCCHCRHNIRAPQDGGGTSILWCPVMFRRCNVQGPDNVTKPRSKDRQHQAVKPNTDSTKRTSLHIMYVLDTELMGFQSGR